MPDRREEIAELCNRLLFVTWDRLAVEENFVAIYGWIGRDDGHSDFVALTFHDLRDPDLPFWFTTSSARYSEEIAMLLYEEPSHSPCQRVEDVFGDLIAQSVTLAHA